MRGADITQEALFTTAHLETLVPKNPPRRPIRTLFNEALKRISGLLESTCAEYGGESIPPERWLRFQMLQLLFTIRSECQLVEQASAIWFIF